MSQGNSSVAERRARIEKLKQERELKELERKQKEVLEAQQKSTQSASNDLIKKILDQSRQDQGLPTFTNLVTTPNEQQQSKFKQLLKIASFVVEMEIAPKRKPETYTREVQCEIIDPKKLGKIAEEEENDSDDFDQRFNKIVDRSKDPRRGSERRASVPTGIVEARRPDNTKRTNTIEQTFIENEIKEMPKDEAKAIMQQTDFQSFLIKSARYIERALGAEFDFRGEFFIDDEKENTGEDSNAKGSRLIKKFVMEEKTDHRRTISSLDWSPNNPELFLASYSKLKEWSMDEPDGLINIYSIAMQTRPELTLNCQYEITKAQFNPYDTNMVIAATTTGYILVWDVRAKKEPVRGVERRDRSQPIQKSCLATHGHNFPVYSMSTIGSQSAHNIVSISNDGRLCQWKPKMLSEPRDYFFLEIPNTIKETSSNLMAKVATGISNTISAIGTASTPTKQHASVHCMEFPENETNKFFVGAEDFNLYQCNLHSESKIHIESALTGHNAPVTAINIHPGGSQNEKRPEMTDLILSSSMDWTIKLWNPKVRSTPLYSFESSQEYIYDVQWSPTHPAVFASVDYAGYLDVWNINQNKENPVVRGLPQEKDPKPLNCLKWAKDGRRIITGDSCGYATLYQVHQDLSQPTEEDFDQISSLLDFS